MMRFVSVGLSHHIFDLVSKLLNSLIMSTNRLLLILDMS